MMLFSYAAPASGPSAGGIGWLNFDNFTINSGDTLTGLTGTLKDGSKVIFDLNLVCTSGQPCTFTAIEAPADTDSVFGRTCYTGLVGNVALCSGDNAAGLGVNTLTMSNIMVVDENDVPIPNFTVIVANAKSYNADREWNYRTNGGPWQLLTSLGNTTPVLTGLGTHEIQMEGSRESTQAACLLTTQAPGQIILTSVESASGRQAISIGIATTRIRLQKYVAWRVDDSDQFQLDIKGTPSGQATTAGDANGVQPQTAQVSAIPGDSYSMNESMAAGSISQLYQYTSVVTAVNATTAGSLPPTGSLPVTFTPALGDDVTYTIYNQAPYTYHKTVDKSHGGFGDILTYTVFIPNPNPYPITDIKFTDPTPSDTTYIGYLSVDKAYSGTDPASGLVITSIPPNGSVTISWKVRINAIPPVPSPVVNVGYVEIPSGNSGVTSFATTDIHAASVTMIKTVDKAYAYPGEVLTYTLILHNEGNAVANDVVIAETLPVGVTLVPGSLKGAAGDFPTLILDTPLAAVGTAIVTYQVKIGTAVPMPNPIAASSSAVFCYTVEPLKPNERIGTAKSNQVTTLVQTAQLSLFKKADVYISYIGDIITYQLMVKNTGNVSADDVVLTDILTVGTVYRPGSLVVNVPATGDPATAITLTNPIASGETVSISFQVTVEAMPNPNPIQNTATAAFTYIVNPDASNGEIGTARSNTVIIPVFRNNYSQSVNDIIHSVAQQQAALGAIANAEGAKIQRIAAMPDRTPEEFLCLNKSVVDMMDSIGMMEAVLKQKLSILSCQINGEIC